MDFLLQNMEYCISQSILKIKYFRKDLSKETIVQRAEGKFNDLPNILQQDRTKVRNKVFC